MSLSAHGIELSLPHSWDGRIYGRPRLVANPAENSLVPGFDGTQRGHLATLHAASSDPIGFALISQPQWCGTSFA